MKLPLKWVSDYIDLPKDLRVFTDKMTMIGHMLDKTIETDTDTVIDLELRGNRADCYGILGLCREAHAVFGGRFDIPNRVALPEEPYDGFSIHVKSPDVYRFYSVVIRNVKVAPSPQWMQTRLRDYGMEPINNIVDITNYVMIESGMPLHAFDLHRIGGDRLELRNARDGETFVSFDGGTLTLQSEDVVFANSEDKVLGLVGIVGGKESGIRDDTTDILLECAAYNQATIRKTLYRYSILTEAGLRHTHDLDASLCDFALPRAAELILTHAAGEGGAELSGTRDYHPKPRKLPEIDFDPHEVTRLGGVSVPVAEQADILRRLDCVVKPSGDRLVVAPPPFRTDITASEDLVEEVLRIWGYEKIPSRALSSAIPLPVEQKELELEERSRDILVALGLDEIITVPLIDGAVIDAMKDPLKPVTIPVLNPPTANHTHLRTSMFAEHLEVAHKIFGRGDTTMAFYEVGKTYRKNEDAVHQPPHKPGFPYIEHRELTALVSSRDAYWDYYRLKGVLETYFSELGVRGITFTKEDDRTLSYPFSLCARAMQGGLCLARIGLVSPMISKSVFSLPYYVYGFVVSIDNLAKATFTLPDYMPYSAFPAVILDMSVQIPAGVQAGDVLATAQTGSELIREVTIEDVFARDGIRSILLRIVYQSKERNLTVEEAREIHNTVAATLEKTYGATIVGRNAP
ncbi:MAG: phenylalanine--tRNA ligase subunit beta [Patescibacteria group bacterium]|nr:phenylalanine--tRNA ligase subunit beta [Patescibacteria group bacterium]